MKHISDDIRKIIPEMRRVQQIHFIGIVDKAVEKPLLGLFGTAKVNVLKLNIALEKANGK